MVATQMSYINHLCCVELQFDEFQFLKQQEKNNIANGENQHEKTFVKIINSNNIQTNDFDYCNLGMIYEVLNKITSIKVDNILCSFWWNSLQKHLSSRTVRINKTASITIINILNHHSNHQP